jgi:SAM-dependent methyltransferase
VRDAYAAASEQYIALFDTVEDGDDADLVRRHLTGLEGAVLDLGCGPGHWAAYLHGLGADVVGIDPVEEFIAHARANHPGPEFRLGSMADVEAQPRSVAGILAWYSTIHLPPSDLDRALRRFRRLLEAGGTLVIGFFDSEDEVGAFDHAVTTAYHWPVDTMGARLRTAGFREVERRQRPSEDRPDRRYAAIAARAD